MSYCIFKLTVNKVFNSIQSPELIEKRKIFADSTFSFWATESKRKRGIGGIFKKGHFRRRESDQRYLFWKESILKPFKGTVMQIEKALIYDRLSVSKVP